MARARARRARRRTCSSRVMSGEYCVRFSSLNMSKSPRTRSRRRRRRRRRRRAAKSHVDGSVPSDATGRARTRELAKGEIHRSRRRAKFSSIVDVTLQMDRRRS
jgi:hypothetical protein